MRNGFLVTSTTHTATRPDGAAYEILNLFSHNELKPQDPFPMMSSRNPSPAVWYGMDHATHEQRT